MDVDSNRQSWQTGKLGITINDAALNSLPIGSDDHTGHDHSGENNWILKSHAKASILPIDHTG